VCYIYASCFDKSNREGPEPIYKGKKGKKGQVLQEVKQPNNDTTAKKEGQVSRTSHTKKDQQPARLLLGHRLEATYSFPFPIEKF